MKNIVELVKKYEDQEQFPRMIGSQGGFDYLILAKDEKTGLQLGIKPMFGVGNVEGKLATLVSFRLRSAYLPVEAKVHQINEPPATATEAKQPHEGWEFPWGEVGNSNTGPRASLVRTLALARGPDEAQFIFDDLDHVRFFGKVQAFLHEHVTDEQFVVTDEDLANYFKASFYPQILAMQASQGDPVKQLELLELSWETKVKDHAAHQEQYDKAKAELQEQIAAAEKGEQPTYHPKAHFGEDELIPMDSVAGAVLKGAKPKLSLIDNPDAPSEGEGSDDGPSFAPGTTDGEIKLAGGSTFENTDVEPDMSAEADHASSEGHNDGPQAA